MWSGPPFLFRLVISCILWYNTKDYKGFCAVRAGRKRNVSQIRASLDQALGLYPAGYAVHVPVTDHCLLYLYSHGFSAFRKPGVSGAAVWPAAGGFCGDRPSQHHGWRAAAGAFAGALCHGQEYGGGVLHRGCGAVCGEDGGLLFPEEFRLCLRDLLLPQLSDACGLQVVLPEADHSEKRTFPAGHCRCLGYGRAAQADRGRILE